MKKRVISKQKVNLDGEVFVGVRFESCLLVYRGIAAVAMSDCEFDDSQFTFDGPAANALDFLGALYRDGGKAVVEAAFDSVRGRAGPRIN
jgi:hypothetical protein